ncbi:MAG: hypothetical protein HPY55_05710 [Firmicutes bacterium]|nr:hypothetical protein [Bacillota bacterium]
MDVSLSTVTLGQLMWLALPCLTTIVTVVQSRSGNGDGSGRNGSARLPLPGLAFEDPGTAVEIVLTNKGPEPIQILSTELPAPDENCSGGDPILRGVAQLLEPGETVFYCVKPHPSAVPADVDAVNGSLTIYPKPRPPRPLANGIWSRLVDQWRRLRESLAMRLSPH